MFKKLFSTILYIALGSAIILFAASYKYPEVGFYIQNLLGVAPCQKPVTYALGSIDPQFNMTNQDILEALSDAEKIWEKEAGKELFTYDPKAKMKVNFIYDYRQEATTKLSEIGLKIENTTDSYENLKAEFLARKSQYETHSRALQSLITTIENAKKKFEEEVKYWNNKGGAPAKTFDELTAERDRLSSLIAEATEIQNNLSKEVAELNYLVDAINMVAREINAGVETYNKVGQSTGKEFDEGIYRSSALGKEIIIYQFRDRTQLVRVLSHELGHSLGLEHVPDSKSIMYELNQSTNLKATPSDVTELKRICRID